MSCWWEHNQDELPDISPDDRLEIEHITGRIPRYLHPLLHRYRGKTWKDVRDDYYNCESIQLIYRTIYVFYNNLWVKHQGTDVYAS